MKKRGFTLIELLAVMGIMIMMSAIVVGAYIGMTRGAAARSAVTHLKGVLAESRQMAILRGKKTYVVFYQDDPWTVTSAVPYYVLCRHEGTATKGTLGASLRDDYNDLEQVVGALVFNLELVEGLPGEYESKAIEFIPGDGTLEMGSAIWQKGNRYGWQLGTKHYLPRGFVFGANNEPETPDPLAFNPDGTLFSVADPNNNKLDRRILLYEEINPNFNLGVEIKYVGTVKALFDA